MKKIFIGLLILLININVFSQHLELDYTKDKNKMEKGKLEQKQVKGLRKLTEKEKQEQLSLPRLKIKKRSKGLPNAVNNAEQSAFRPIFNQSGNCCGQASGVTYNYTYEMNLLWGTSADAAESQFPSHYTWNFLNGGIDWGSWYFDGWDLILDNGCPTIETFGSINAGDNNSFWMSGYNKYLKSMKNTMLEYKTIRLNTVQGINDLKQWMYDHGRGDAIGGLANFSALSTGYVSKELPAGTPEAGKKAITSWGTDGAHAMTLVGYNDDICWDYNHDGKYTNDIDISGDGIVDAKDWEKGAFIIANSWGDSWGNDGYAYLMYRVCAYNDKEGGLQNSQLVHIINIKEKNKIDLALKIKMRHSYRGKISFKVGINPDITATRPSESRKLKLFNEMGGAHGMNGNSVPGNTPFEFGIDISDFADQIVDDKARIFLEIYSKDGEGEIISASVMDYRTDEKEHTSLFNGKSIKDGNNKISIDILPTGTAKLILSSTSFLESIENDGSLSEDTISLKNASFSKTTGDLVEGTDYTITNVPAGLSAKIKILNANEATLSLIGNATNHEKVNNTDLSIVFSDAAFNGNTAEEIVGSSQNLEITFRDEYITVYQDIDDIIISNDNIWKYFYLGVGDAEYGAWRFNDPKNPEYILKLETYSKGVICYDGTNNLIPLAYGDEIATTSPWYVSDRYPNQPDLYSTDFTEWAGKTAYIGIRIKTYEGIYHGWITTSVATDGLSYTIKDAAYYNKPGGTIMAGKAHETMLQFKTDTIYEDVVNNNGGLEDSLTARLFNCSYTVPANTVLQAGTYYNITGVPDGLEEEITINKNNFLSIKLKGHAESHNKADLAKINIKFLDALFDGISASEIKNANSFNINIKFVDEYKIVYKDIEDFTVSSSNIWLPFNFDNKDYNFGAWFNDGYLRLETNERIAIGYKGTLHAKPLAKGTPINLDSETWVQTGPFPSEIYITDNNFTEWHGKEAYVGVSINSNGHPCYGWINIEVNTEGTAYTVKEWAYNEQPYGQINAGETKFINNPSISVGDGTFVEPYTNDGSLTGTASIQILNDEFALETGTILTQGSHFTIANLPEGLRCKLEVINKNKIALSLTKNATAHKKENNCEISITLKDVVFLTNTAANVENSTFTCKTSFKEPWDIIYKDIADITANSENKFTCFNMEMGTHGFAAWWYNKNGQMKFESYENYVICNPGTINLIPLDKGTVISDNSIEWYQGKDFPDEPDLDNDNFHEWLGKEAYVGVALKNGEFWHFGWIRISVAADGKSYTVLDHAYNDQPGAPILAGQKIASDKAILDASTNIFQETYDNDGELMGENYVMIANGKFNTSLSSLEQGTHYSVENLAEGLDTKISILNKDSLFITITGKATNHESINNQEITITFKESVFQDLKLENILTNECKFNIKFRNDYKIVYVDNPDIICNADNTWTLLEIIPGLDNVGIWLYKWENFKLETYENKAICCPNTNDIKLLDADVILDKNTIGWTAYDEFPNELNIANRSYTDLNGKEGYIGLQLEDEGYLFHAWIRISVAADGKSYSVLDFAYNEAPNKSIYTGSHTYIPVKPQVDFTSNKTQIFKDGIIEFADFSTYNPTEWSWTFNGGQPANSVEQNPSIAYNQTGVYDVSLTATNEDGSNSQTKTSMITVHEEGPAMADFTADITIIKPGETVNFNDASVGIPTTWEWKFEGAIPAVSSEQNPSVVYPESGTYKVELIATNEFGSTQKVRENYITVQDINGYCTPSHAGCGYWYNINTVQLNNLKNTSDTQTSSPTYVDYSDLQANVVQGETTNLTVKTANSKNLYLSLYIDWNGDKDFDDANETYTPIIMETGTTNITINVPVDAQLGFVRMRLRTASYDAVTSACSIEAAGGETEDYSIYISAPEIPVADFEANKTIITVGDNVLLTDKSSNNPTSWAWELEGANETTSSKANLFATYSTAGTYPVKLTASNDQGNDSETKVDYITVTSNKETPNPEFSPDKTAVMGGETVRFINETEYRPDATYAWTFEGGEPKTSPERDPEVEYYFQGLYSVTLEVSTPEGTKNISKDDLIKVSEAHKPVAKFKSDKKVILTDGKIQFADLSSNEPTSWAWVFEGGTPNTSTEQNPIVTYDIKGTYKVSLIATNDYGASEAIEKVDYITVNEFSANGYCEAKNVYEGNWLEIKNVNLGEIDNTSGLSEYSDFTNFCTDLNINGAYEMSVSYGNSWDSNGLFVWIDWNNDKTFSESERVFFGNNDDNDGLENFQITVPADAVEGYTVMRLRTAYSTTSNPCGTINYAGEVEDYAIHVTNYSVGPKAYFAVTNQELEEGKSVIFSHTSEGNPTSIQWTFEGGTPETSTEENPVVTYATVGNYDVSLLVTNADGSDTETKVDYMTVNVVATNHAPLNITLSKNSIDENVALNTAIGNFEAIDEDDSDKHTFTFATVDGTNDADNSSFTIDGATLKVNTSLDFETKSEYEIYVQAEDATGETCKKDFTINVNDIVENMPATEIILSKTDIDENLPEKTVVAELTATDPDDGDTHTFSLQIADDIIDADNNSFSISGNQLLSEASFDFETQSELKINLRVTDNNKNNFDQAFTITVNDIFENHNPTAISLSNLSISENATSGIFFTDLSATDVDPDESFTFELVDEDGFNSEDNDSFEIKGDELFTAASFDYESTPELHICVKVTDNHSGTYIKEFTILVEDVNENNKPTDIQLSKHLVEKSAKIGSLVATLSAVDNDLSDTHTFRLYPSNGISDADNNKFVVDGANLNLNADINSLTGYLKINVKVTDNAGASMCKAVEIKIVDEIINSAPTDISLSNNSIYENATIGTVIGELTATDADADDTHTFSFVDGGSDNSSFIINGANLKLNTVLDYETKSLYTIKVKVTDAAGDSFEKELSINVNENATPTDIALSNNSIDEDAAIGTIIGELSATDADADDTHTFSFADGGSDNSSFTIDGANLKLNTALDYETKFLYSIKIKVTDVAGDNFEKEFSINVNDVDENSAPTDISLSNNSIDEDAAIGTIIGELTATDADADDIHTFSFVDGGTDNSSFTIDGANLKLNTALDYETKSLYTIKVKVTDVAGANFQKEFTIKVLDVTSINNISDIECKIYPNPVINKLNINCNKVDRIEIYNSLGNRKIIHQNKLSNFRISVDVLNLNSGIYFVKIILSNKTEIIRKIIIK
ncbi:MAG: cadherin domain-containing protein [Bacteroidetes bacterium]|nr:cadherin domain-containing protein [Bacteroidota bacterium]